MIGSFRELLVIGICIVCRETQRLFFNSHNNADSCRLIYAENKLIYEAIPYTEGNNEKASTLANTNIRLESHQKSTTEEFLRVL